MVLTFTEAPDYQDNSIRVSADRQEGISPSLTLLQFLFPVTHILETYLQSQVGKAVARLQELLGKRNSRWAAD